MYGTKCPNKLLKWNEMTWVFCLSYMVVFFTTIISYSYIYRLPFKEFHSVRYTNVDLNLCSEYLVVVTDYHKKHVSMTLILHIWMVRSRIILVQEWLFKLMYFISNFRSSACQILDRRHKNRRLICAYFGDFLIWIQRHVTIHARIKQSMNSANCSYQTLSNSTTQITHEFIVCSVRLKPSHGIAYSIPLFSP